VFWFIRKTRISSGSFAFVPKFNKVKWKSVSRPVFPKNWVKNNSIKRSEPLSKELKIAIKLKNNIQEQKENFSTLQGFPHLLVLIKHFRYHSSSQLKWADIQTWQILKTAGECPLINDYNKNGAISVMFVIKRVLHRPSRVNYLLDISMFLVI
jgi:hypothetical protein